MANFFKNIIDTLGGAVAAIPQFISKGGSPDPTTQLLTSAGSALLGSVSKDMAQNSYISQQNALFDKQAQFANEMFDKQLAANRRSIIDQYNQYREIGINPLSANMSQSSMANQAATPSVGAPNYQSPLENAQMRLLDAQTAKTNAEAAAIDPQESRSRTYLNMANAEQIKALQDGLIKLQDSTWRFNESQIKVNESNLHKINKEIDVLNEQSAKLASETTMLMNQNKYFDKDKALQYALSNKQLKFMSAQEKQIYESISQQWANILQGIAESNERIGLIRSQKQGHDIINLSNGLDYDLKNDTYLLRLDSERAKLNATISRDENDKLHIDFDTSMFEENTGYNVFNYYSNWFISPALRLFEAAKKLR